MEEQKPTIELNEEQKRAVALVRKGENIFLTGPAGTGKSLTLEHIIKDAEELGEQVYVTATTGIAASHLGSVSTSVRTFHSWAGIGLGKYPASSHAKFIRRNPVARERIVQTDLLIVDEVSMLDADFLAKVNDVVKIVRSKDPGTSHLADKPFGGIQLVFTGDFGQLPPVQKNRPTPRFLFEDPLWSQLVNETVVLSRVYRQKDKSFVDLLTRLRNNTVTNEDVARIRATVNNDLGDGTIKPTVLFCRNMDVDRMNMQELQKLEGKAYTFKCSEFFMNEHAKKDFGSGFNLPADLPLKVGAQVMLMKNDNPAAGLVNGSRGVVTAINLSGDNPDELDSIEVKFLNGEVRTYERHTQESKDESGAVVAWRKQFPFKLAWCMTVHKSQGMTIDLLEIDLRGAFEVAQAYVAISRGVGLDRMRVRNFTRECVKTSPTVLQFQHSIERVHKRKREGDGDGESSIYKTPRVAGGSPHGGASPGQVAGAA
jgi:ATP-dependent DNA helicase PIF1